MADSAKSKLTEEAQAAITEAVRIVREDRFEAFVRGRVSGPKSDANPGPGDPPPPKPGDPVTDTAPKKKGLYWGDEV